MIQGFFGVLKILSFTVVVESQSGWTSTEIDLMVSRANLVLAQCQIQVVSDVPTFYLGQMSMDYDVISLANAFYKTSQKPVMFLIKATQYNGSAGWAPGNNFIFISQYALTEKYKSARDPKYEILAHELGHMLGDLEHLTSSQENLMSGYINYQTDLLTPQQCARMRGSKHLQDTP